MATEILCSRCGTPFPQERGKTSVTCVVCGQLRPDLDMTLDDDEDVAGGFADGAASAITPPAPVATAPVAASHIARPTEVADPSIPPPPRPYLSLNEETYSGEPRAAVDSLTDRIGPVLLVATPLAAGMAGALNMLSIVPDFSRGSWYAVGAVFLALLIGSLLAGLIASGIFFTLRLRASFFLRVLFLAAAAAVAFLGARDLPSHVQVRENELPGFMLRH